MRKMECEFAKVNVVEWIMTSNFWEYYITDDKHNDGIAESVR